VPIGIWGGEGIEGIAGAVGVAVGIVGIVGILGIVGIEGFPIAIGGTGLTTGIEGAVEPTLTVGF